MSISRKREELNLHGGEFESSVKDGGFWLCLQDGF